MKKTDKSPVNYPYPIYRKDKLFVRNIINNVANFINNNIPKGTPIAVSCSAGIDSICLSDILYRVWRILERNPVNIFHVNHGLRPKENPLEHELLDSFCKERNLNLYILNGKTYKGAGLQERAREIRYNAIRNQAKKLGIKHIFIAHNKNDSIENILIRTFQGRVLNNNGNLTVFGIRPISETPHYDYSIIKVRPLLNLTRKDIEKYVKIMKLSWHEDSSNSTDDYLRNYIRHNIIPKTFLGEEF